ncbi:IS3 family transposase [Streptomyces sp. NBC_00233]|uniref:IS3 family transposase n=1 Tax=Streptomyces sp. NBC_00233 TaxID=2975686 RepID=UPI00224D5C08|nr:IS3 family transposase [Streptomyces sp. NBC_00233]MCX5233398.1 IS3 family transposase [Streptomyces sp. NBC_00233]
MNVDPFIEAEKTAGHNVKRTCEPLKVSRTAYYARRNGNPGPRAVRDAELTEQITVVHQQSRGTYGAPRVHAALKRNGAGCGRRRVARLMRQAGLTGRHRRRRHRTTVPDPHAATHPDLVLRDFQPDQSALGTRWCGDITYIATDEGWLYLATVIDIASRRAVGWATADHLRTELVADALMAACRTRRPASPVIFHSDRGCQYTSRELATLAGKFDIRLSAGRTGQCWDNALAESFFSTLKNELGDAHRWPSRADARTAIFDGSRAGTTCTGSTAASATAAPPNTRPHSQPDHRTKGVRQSGTSSLPMEHTAPNTPHPMTVKADQAHPVHARLAAGVGRRPPRVVGSADMRRAARLGVIYPLPWRS